MSAGNGIGEAIKGAVNTIHGAGEAIRGNINDGLDSAGEGIRHADSEKGHPPTSDTSTIGKSSDYDTAGNQRGVADKGVDEFKQGIQQISSAFNSNANSTSTSTHNTST